MQVDDRIFEMNDDFFDDEEVETVDNNEEIKSDDSTRYEYTIIIQYSERDEGASSIDNILRWIDNLFDNCRQISDYNIANIETNKTVKLSGAYIYDAVITVDCNFHIKDCHDALKFLRTLNNFPLRKNGYFSSEKPIVFKSKKFETNDEFKFFWNTYYSDGSVVNSNEPFDLKDSWLEDIEYNQVYEFSQFLFGENYDFNNLLTCNKQGKLLAIYTYMFLESPEFYSHISEDAHFIKAVDNILTEPTHDKRYKPCAAFMKMFEFEQMNHGNYTSPWCPTQRNKDITEFCNTHPFKIYAITKSDSDGAKEKDECIMFLYDDLLNGMIIAPATEKEGNIVTMEKMLYAVMPVDEADEIVKKYFPKEYEDYDEYYDEDEEYTED